MTKYDELAARVEAATGPDRNLDAMVHARDGIEGVGAHSMAPPYTASLDAAMTLVMPASEQWGEYVSVSLWHSNGVHPEHIRATAWVRGAARVYAATPALALCAASLRSRASQGEQS